MNLEEILMSDDIVKSINDNTKYLLQIIPELEEYFYEHNHPHHIDGPIWRHVLLTLSLSEKDFDVRLALLLHDIGKQRKSVVGKDEFNHYKGHAEESARMANEILRRLGFDEEYVRYICYLIRYHDTMMSETPMFKDGEYGICETLYKIQCCDALAHHPNHLEKRKRYLEETRKLLDQYGRTYGKNRNYK